MTRPNPLANPEYAKLVAESFAAGMSRRQMCVEFGVKDPDTITRWRRDPRVKSYALKLIEDRILQVTRKVDGKIAAMLDRDDLSIMELIAIRKEFLGGALRAQTEKADESTIAEAQDWLERNPDAADQLDALLRGGALPGAVAASNVPFQEPPAPGDL